MCVYFPHCLKFCIATYFWEIVYCFPRCYSLICVFTSLVLLSTIPNYSKLCVCLCLLFSSLLFPIFGDCVRSCSSLFLSFSPTRHAVCVLLQEQVALGDIRQCEFYSSSCLYLFFSTHSLFFSHLPFIFTHSIFFPSFSILHSFVLSLTHLFFTHSLTFFFSQSERKMMSYLLSPLFAQSTRKWRNNHDIGQP